MSTLATQPAIQATGLTKGYRLGEHVGLKRTIGGLLPWSHVPSHRFAALRDVAFSVPRGECFGIVGGNGSGKSTVLQIAAGITSPTAGSMTVRGRVLPLLAVGTGFHPELTGRENVLLFGTILGLQRSDIEGRIDDVIAFAQLERHIDTPAKRYSDGMLARLSFAVAVEFPADIYIFDEVLAVVDGEFRIRCLDAIERLSQRGRTVLFVSHDLDQVARLCDRVMWLDRGSVKGLGKTEPVLDEYAAREH